MLYTVHNIVKQATSNGTTVNLCAIDLSKAFDKVDHNAVLIKLMKRKVPLILLELLEDLFRECYSCIKWNDIMSSFFTIKFGVRQGSVLSSYVFVVYVNYVDYSNTGCHVTLYADDILVMFLTMFVLILASVILNQFLKTLPNVLLKNVVSGVT